MTNTFDTDIATSKNTPGEAILQLLYFGRLHAKCPSCNKYLAFFEVYNANCSECGSLNFQEIKVIDIVGDDYYQQTSVNMEIKSYILGCGYDPKKIK